MHKWPTHFIQAKITQIGEYYPKLSRAKDIAWADLALDYLFTELSRRTDRVGVQ